MARSKTVIGADDRQWTVRRNIEWSRPATNAEFEREFEHDVDGGRAAAVMILSTLFLFYVVLIVWEPAQVHTPWWLILIGILIIAFFPIRWALRRPWTLIAETPGVYGADKPPERYLGNVRGVTRSREEFRQIVRRIQTQGTPTYVDGPLEKQN